MIEIEIELVDVSELNFDNFSLHFNAKEKYTQILKGKPQFDIDY